MQPNEPALTFSDQHAELEKMSAAERWLRRLSVVNDAVLLPLCVLIVAEVFGSGTDALGSVLAIGVSVVCALFLAEWLGGLVLAEDRRGYLLDPTRLADLVSALPVGLWFQSLRLVRLVRIIYVLRLIWRSRRFQGRGDKVFRVVAVLGGAVAAGAFGLRLAEPETAPDIGSALWWSITTLSTVGYGDVVPTSEPGRAIASVLMVFGVGAFGWVAGTMATLVEDPEEEESLRLLRSIEARLARLEDGGRSASDGVGDVRRLQC